MVAAQYDSWQLSHLVHGYDGLENRPTYTAAEKQYAEAEKILEVVLLRFWWKVWQI